jgi:putative hydrolase of the HAD superfamily
MASHKCSFNTTISRRIVNRLIEIDQRGTCARKIFIEQLLTLIPELNLTPGKLWHEFQRLPDYVEQDFQIILMLKRLSLRHDMTIVSNGSGAIQRRKMTNAGIDQFFKTCFISGEKRCAKPNKKLFLKALRHFGYEPTNAVMIGDHPDKDIRAAKLLGMKTVLVANDKNIKNRYADTVITDILQLEEVLSCLI